MATKLKQLINCRILREHRIIQEDLWIRDGKIINPEVVFFDEKIQADIKIDCKNGIIAPGFIELQINGGFGYDFSHTEDAEKAVQVVGKNLLVHGVTSFLPTIVTSPKEVYNRVLKEIKVTDGGINGATVLGIHIEGPFINVEKKGAHPPNFIRKFNQGFDTLKEIYGSLENAKIITLAPELEHGCDIIKKLVEKNIVVSVGHSMADLQQGEAAVQCGASFITHLFNAMLPFHHRDPGLVGLLASDQIPLNKTIYFGIISDGIHTHPAALRIAHRTHPSGLVLVTDAISALGLEEGKHTVGQFEIEIRDSRAYVAGTNTLCGSIATMNECVKIFKEATDCTKEYALEAASLHPAQVLGIADKKGSLNFGNDADFVILNDDLDVLETWIAGEQVYCK